MRTALLIMVMTFCGSSATAQPNAINVRDMSAPNHSIFFPPTSGATLKPGVLVDISRPQFLAKESMRLEGTAGPVMPVSAMSVAVVAREDRGSTYRQVAQAVEDSLSFFGKGKVELSDEDVEGLRQNSIYARIVITDGVQSLDTRPKWQAGWKLPAAGTPADRTKAFVTEYGTHYIHKLYYGRTISIKATIKEGDKARKQALEAKLRAKFLSFSLDGNYAQKAKADTYGYPFDLSITVQGGSANRGERLLLRSFGELDVFLKELRDGQFKIASVPVAADLLSLSGLTGDDAINGALRGDLKFTEAGKYDAARAEQLKALRESPNWYWQDPRGPKHLIAIKFTGDESLTITDQAGQSGSGSYNPQENRFDIKEGKLAGHGFYISESKTFVLVTLGGSAAVYHEGRP